MTCIQGCLTNGRPTYLKHLLYLQVAQITNFTFKEALFLLHQKWCNLHKYIYIYLQVAHITNFTFKEALFLLHQVQENIAYDLHVNYVFLHWTVVHQRKNWWVITENLSTFTYGGFVSPYKVQTRCVFSTSLELIKLN